MMSTLPAPSRLDAPPAIDLPTGDPPILITIGLVKLLIRRGQLHPVKLGRLTRIPRAQLTAMFVPAEQQCSCNPPSEPVAERRRGCRANGEGAIWQEGKYHAGRITIDGQRHQVRAKTREAVAAKLFDLRQKAATGTLTDTRRKWTVGEWLDEWLSGLFVDQVTLDGYSRPCRVHIKPAFGHLPLASLGTQQIRAFCQRKMAPRSEGGAGLHQTTVHNIGMTLRTALGAAVDLNYLARNPAAVRRTIPPPANREMQTWEADECQRFLAAAKGCFYEDLFHFALPTGARQGEIRALRWSALDLDAGTVSIKASISGGRRRKSTKTDSACGQAAPLLDAQRHGPPRAHRGPLLLVAVRRDRRRRRVALSAVERGPADVVPQPLVVEYQFTDRVRQLVALPLALESPCALALSFRRGGTCGLDRIGGRTELVRGDVWYRGGLGGSVRGMPWCATQISSGGVRMAGRRARLGHGDLAAHPGAGLLDRLPRSPVLRPNPLEEVEDVLRTRRRPQREELMIRAGEGSTTADRHESRVAVFRQDHAQHPFCLASAGARV